MTIERPILFSGTMVQALQARRKSQTRRTRGLETINLFPNGWNLYDLSVINSRTVATFRWRDTQHFVSKNCPYGAPGERLWVRETWNVQTVDKVERVAYRADIPNGYSFVPWRPSIFMPRWASRITLEITDVRVERVRDISEADARAEGVEKPSWDNASYRVEFCRVWDAINAKRDYGWQANPWVWGIEFKQVTP